MTNRLRSEIKEERIIEQEPVMKPKPAKISNPNSFTRFFYKNISKEAATEALPFVVFLALLAMIYIGNRHSAENNIRQIDQLSKEVKELSWDFKTLKADLMFKSKQTEVIKRVDSLLGLQVSIKPPIKIKAD